MRLRRPGPVTLGPRADRRGPGHRAGAACAATCPGRTRSRRRSPRCTATPPTAADTDWGADRRPVRPAAGVRARRRSSRSTGRSRSPSATAPAPALAAARRARHGLDGYHLFHAARAELLARLGRRDEARRRLRPRPRAHRQRRRARAARPPAGGGGDQAGMSDGSLASVTARSARWAARWGRCDMAELEAKVLVDQAVEAAGHDDFDGDDWRESLDQLLDSLNREARLSELGQAIAGGEVVAYLTGRLGVVEEAKEHPEIAEAPVTPPIVIVGQGRTGTTILFDLLAQDPATRVPRTWEVDLPCPPPETATYETDPRIAQVERHPRRRRPRAAGLPGDAPDGGAARAGVRAHHRPRLPQLHLPHAVPRAELRPLAAGRGRHGPGLPLAPHVPPAPAVTAPGRTLGCEVARPHLAPRRPARRVPRRAPRADPPRSAADHRLHRLAGPEAPLAGQRRRRRARGRR